METHSSRRIGPRKVIGVVLAGWALFGGAGCKTEAQQTTVVANIDTTHVAAPIWKYLYGGFIEHGGRWRPDWR